MSSSQFDKKAMIVKFEELDDERQKEAKLVRGYTSTYFCNFVHKYFYLSSQTYGIINWLSLQVTDAEGER